MVDFLGSVPVMLALGNVITVIIYHFMLDTFYLRKPWASKAYISGLVFTITCIALTWINLQGIPLFNTLSMLAAYLIPMLLMYQVNNLRGIGYFVFYIAGTIMSELGIMALAGGLGEYRGNRTDYSHLTPMLMVALNVLQIVIAVLLCKLGNKERDKRYDKVTLLFLVMPIITLLIMFMDLIMITMDMVENFNDGQFVRMLLLLLISNIIIFAVLESYTRLYKKELNASYEKIKAQADAHYMELATGNMRKSLEAAKKMNEQDRLMRHDRRHFESMLLMLLEGGQVDEAKEALQERLKVEPRSELSYCENSACNAAISGYAKLAEADGIELHVACNIPQELKTDSLELAIAISNLLENAIHACQKIEDGKKEIRFFAKYKDQLLLEMENTFCGKVDLDENGRPTSREEGHGVGTKSVVNFVEENDGVINYIVNDNSFKVRILL